MCLTYESGAFAQAARSGLVVRAAAKAGNWLPGEWPFWPATSATVDYNACFAFRHVAVTLRPKTTPQLTFDLPAFHRL